MSLAATFLQAIGIVVGLTTLWFTVDRIWHRVCPERASGATGCGACTKSSSCGRNKGEETCTLKS